MRVTGSSLDSGATARHYTVTARDYTGTGTSPHSPLRFHKRAKRGGGGGHLRRQLRFTKGGGGARLYTVSGSWPDAP
jgi:hypothetical protein